MRVIAAIWLLVSPCLHAGEMYRHIDEKGNVVFSDRPKQAGQIAEKKKTTNVASGEARRQLEMERAEVLHQRREEQFAAQRRAAAPRPYTPPNPPRYGRHDPSLPDSPPVDSERRYYYNR